MTAAMDNLVTVNVGGCFYQTTRTTLTGYPDSMLGCMFSGRIPSHRDQNGNYIIDGDGPIFRHVLNFLRRSTLCLPDDFNEWDLLTAEADFYQIKELVDAVTSLKEDRVRPREGGRQEMEFIEIIFCSNGELTFRGSAETLKQIPTLRGFFQAHANRDACILERLKQDGIIMARHGVVGPNRMAIFQEITSQGFGFLNTSIWESKNLEKWLFGCNIK